MHSKQLVGATAVVLLLTLLLVAACAGPAAPEPENVVAATAVPSTRGDIVVDLPDLGAAPEFQNDVWLNSDGPVTLAEQRGKVVLLEFWTFGCINCLRTIPFVQEWQAQYEGAD